jgi:sulfopyruvate decarboxylase TPP-binding subunit
VCDLPDAGHARLIALSREDPAIKTTVLTTEEEGVALCAGAWLGGDRAVLPMQSSGVGNRVNMLSRMNSCRLPLLAIVTMRGEWAELHDIGSGPHFARIKIARGNPERALQPRDGTFVKNRLRRHLGFAVT